MLTIDKKPDLVQEIKDSANQAILADATERKTLEAMGLGQMDAVVVCIGKDLTLSLAECIHNPRMIDYLPFLEGYSIIEL